MADYAEWALLNVEGRMVTYIFNYLCHLISCGTYTPPENGWNSGAYAAPRVAPIVLLILGSISQLGV